MCVHIYTRTSSIVMRCHCRVCRFPAACEKIFVAGVAVGSGRGGMARGCPRAAASSSRMIWSKDNAGGGRTPTPGGGCWGWGWAC